MGLQNCESVCVIAHERQPDHKVETEKELLLLQLPLHILFDILSRLTFESIFSCRCVCSKFMKLLNDPYFDKLHLTRTPDSDYSTLTVQDKVNASDLFFVQFDYNSCTCVTLTVPKTVSKMKNPITTLIGSCNGLLCIRYTSTYYVCNPILGEFVVLPHDTPSSLQPSTFGYCPKTKQYKVIRFVVDSLYCKIHTLGTSNWRTIIDIPLPESPSSFDSSLNGNFHWITKSKTASNLICSFNLETEKFLYMSPPKQLDQVMINRISHMSVGALSGLFSISYVLDSYLYEIWVMKNYGIKESWIKKIKFYGATESSILNHPVIYLNNGDVLIKCDKTSSLLCSRSTKKDEFRVLMDTGIELMSAIAHLPSFISLEKYATKESVEIVHREKTVVQKGEDVKRLYCPSNSLRQSYSLLS